MPSNIREGVCDLGIRVSNGQVVGVKELEYFEFVQELVNFCSVFFEDLGFASLEDEFITSNRDDYVQGCVWKGVWIWGRSRRWPGASVLGYRVNRGWWCWGSDC